MKVIKNFACASLFLLLASCGGKTTYWNALPEESAAVASFNLSRLATRAKLDGRQGEEMIAHLKEMIKSGLEGSGQLIDRVFADASESGIDLKEKVYIFSTDENAVLGLLAKVISSDKLHDIADMLAKEQLCQPIRETDGCSWTVLGKWLLAYSDDALLVLSDNKWSDPSKLVRQASMWLRQEDGQGFASQGDFQKFQSTESDISVWTSLQVLPRKVITPLTMGLSAELDLKKTKAITSVNFEVGKTIIDVDPLITDHVVKQLMDRKSLVMLPIKGNHLDLFPAKTSFWMGANLKGQEFYHLIREIPAIRKSLDHSDLPITLDYGRVFEAIDGDVSFTITDISHGYYILWADVKQTDFLKYFADLKLIIAKTNGKIMLEDRGDNNFCLATRDGTLMNLRPGLKIFWFGVKDGRFYLTNNDELIDQRVLGLSLRNKSWGKRAVGSNFFAVSDWNSLRVFEYYLQQDVLKELPKAVPGIMNYVTIESVDGQHIRCIIEQNEKNLNLIQLLFQL